MSGIAVSGDEPEKTEEEIIEERRAARRKATADARHVQYLIDLKMLDELEGRHGEQHVKALHTPSFSAGLPTLVIVKAPEGGSYKRFCDQVAAAKDNVQMKQQAGHMLARACIVYPDAPTQALMLVAFPNMLNDAANAAATFVQLRSESEKKD